MSNLWVQATQFPWYGAERLSEQRPELARRVAQEHGVPVKAANKVVNLLGARLYAGKEFLHPVREGRFASAPKTHVWQHHLLPANVHDFQRWRDVPVQDVGTDQPIHAVQGRLYARGVAHNLFWPGHDIPAGMADPQTGHPDIEPPPAKRAAPPVDMVRTPRGLWVVDGHHRVAADLMLGKPTTRARVLDADRF